MLCRCRAGAAFRCGAIVGRVGGLVAEGTVMFAGCRRRDVCRLIFGASRLQGAGARACSALCSLFFRPRFHSRWVSLDGPTLAFGRTFLGAQVPAGLGFGCSWAWSFVSCRSSRRGIAWWCWAFDCAALRPLLVVVACLHVVVSVVVIATVLMDRGVREEGDRGSGVCDGWFLGGSGGCGCKLGRVGGSSVLCQCRGPGGEVVVCRGPVGMAVGSSV